MGTAGCTAVDVVYILGDRMPSAAARRKPPLYAKWQPTANSAVTARGVEPVDVG